MSRDKWQTLHDFWSSFGIPAYDTASVPDDAVMPYITYTALTAPFEITTLLTADIWYRSTAWNGISNKADEIGADVGIGKLISLQDGKQYIYLAQGSPFAQRIYDTDETVKRVRINLMGEFFVFH